MAAGDARCPRCVSPAAKGGAMGTEQPHTFGALLTHFRQAAGLTQEALAERAQLSVRGLSDLEHGRTRTPRPDTVALLVTALGLSARERAVLVAVARGRDGPGVAAAPVRFLPAASASSVVGPTLAPLV